MLRLLMLDQKQIERLSHIDDFKAFLQEVKDRREAAILQLHDRPDGSVQQLAGRILEGAEILNLGGWDEIDKRRT